MVRVQCLAPRGNDGRLMVQRVLEDGAAEIDQGGCQAAATGTWTHSHGVRLTSAYQYVVVGLPARMSRLVRVLGIAVLSLSITW